MESTASPQENFLARWFAWVRRAGRLELAILAAIFVAVAALWAFGTMAAEVVEGDTGKFDEHLLLALRQPGNLAVPIGPSWGLQVARDLTAFGGPVGIGLVTMVVGGYLALQRKFGLLGFVLGSLVSGTVLGMFLKEMFHRPRPEVIPHLTDIATASFPSGHSMLSSVAYLTLAALLARAAKDLGTKIYFLAVAVVLIGLIGFSRVYLGVHYPTDVLAGWCVGSAWAIICCAVAHFIQGRRAIPLAEELGNEIVAHEDGPTGT